MPSHRKAFFDFGFHLKCEGVTMLSRNSVSLRGKNILGLEYFSGRNRISVGHSKRNEKYHSS